MRLLTKKNIEKVFTMKDAIEADKEAYRIYTQEKSDVPLRTNIQVKKQDASMLFMPGYVEDLDCAGIKIVSVFPNNVNKNKPVIPATVLLLDGETGEVSSVLDGTYITQLRTGAASGAAIDLLAKQNSKIGTLIGIGGQAKCQLEAMLTARELEKVYIYNRNVDKVNEFVKRMELELAGKYNTKLIPTTNCDEAIENADIIVTATTSTEPVFDGNKVKKGALISGVGSYMANMQEIHPQAIKRADKVFFDSKEACLAEAGDIIIPLNDNTIDGSNFKGEIGAVVSKEVAGRENDEEIIVFKSVGIAVQDIVTAKEIYDRAVKHNVGVVWE